MGLKVGLEPSRISNVHDIAVRRSVSRSYGSEFDSVPHPLTTISLISTVTVPFLALPRQISFTTSAVPLGKLCIQAIWPFPASDDV
jgi:hypothetical protein